MKRLFALVLAVLMIAALLCACGEKAQQTNASGSAVKIAVDPKYDEGFANSYAQKTSTDENGNKVYEFTDSQYEAFTKAYNNTLSAKMQEEIVANHDKSYGEYIYINEEKKAVIIGVHEDQYDEKVASEEAASLAEYGFKYFQNLQNPVDAIRVVYCDANDQNVEFGSFSFTAA